MPSQFKIRTWNAAELPQDWFSRAQALDESIEKDVKAIIAEIRIDGDTALLKFTAKFDKANVKPESLRVTPEEVKAAYGEVTDEQVKALTMMKEKVGAFERGNLQQLGTATLIDGVTIQTMLSPIQSVGCYVPGGKAAYPSTVVMTTVPAKVAGVPRIVVCSPPDKDGKVNPLVLVACDICGVDEVYRVGGVQAVAALAYGTEAIKPVCKIVGPGSKYVTMAKVLVSKDVAIDMPAGPSEVLVLADETANAKFVAADLVSQAEHGADSVVGLITTSRELAEEVSDWLARMAASAERGEIVQRALETNGFIITCGAVSEMVELANTFAPEHLEIMTRLPLEIADKITSAGVILVGVYSPVALSDYGIGTNHVLPTGGFARSYSGLSALDFVRRVSVIDYTKESLRALRGHVRVLTEAEKLPNHSRAVEVRFEE
jgi:histidinol dehydrogenase